MQTLRIALKFDPKKTNLKKPREGIPFLKWISYNSLRRNTDRWNLISKLDG